MTTASEPSGGLAPVYADACEVIEEVDQDLTLRGLMLIHTASREAGT